MIAGLTNRYKAANNIDKIFTFPWQYLHLTEEEIAQASEVFAGKYSGDVSQDQLKEEIILLKSIHYDNFGDKALSPQDLLNKISEFNLYEIFGNICVTLRIFCTLPVTVASAERSFSKLNLIKNFMRSTLTQERLNDLAVLSIESKLTRKIDFTSVINSFALKKARKAVI